MIIPKPARLSPEQLAEISAIVEPFGCRIQPIIGAVRNIYAIVGDERDELMTNRLEGLPYIERVDKMQSPYKLMDRRSSLSGNKIKIGNLTIGEDLLVIAGQCTIDPKNPNYFYETAHAVKEAGANSIRGGVWKPRTNPYSFQGDNKSLDILMEAHRRTGLPVDAEVMDEHQLHLAIEAGVHMLQVGARNALNYSLLRAIGGAVASRPSTVVLLKRSIHMGPLNEFISAAEYIAAFGNPNILLCPRGTSPAIDGYRNHPDESITPLLKEKTWAPVVVDPSHSVGKAAYVPACALAAVAYGADGLCIESHISPSKGIGDDPKQALTPEMLAYTIREARQLWAARREARAHAPEGISPAK
ncbi:3-deoxy-D-arabino-heptulosonate 7-phosphate synthase [Ereboglobus luteus]|uniref:3-deoxy-D-arabino-heptulosonate 7-phosphate synthase n=1 Tax=Ereboglobus luteus TaxID=1796921 RepID=A0A2U8E1V4_9BACT|nr:3-deoxy-D-arabino-heptulosonate 7-phosphate synthase [Ereboglobus luteus]AWI08843.1 3-deoxy-D-arabino-heptulosonate 7-phosphate synthase [Ereboglobus luteus]